MSAFSPPSARISRMSQKYEPPADIDLADAEERFHLISIPKPVKDRKLAFIKDLKTGKSVLLGIGEKIGGYTLQKIELKGPDGEVTSLSRYRSDE